jgi:hypothetical protein
LVVQPRGHDVRLTHISRTVDANQVTWHTQLIPPAGRQRAVSLREAIRSWAASRISSKSSA